MFISILLTVSIIILLIAAFVFAIIPIFPGIVFTLGAIAIYIFWKGIEALGVFNFGLIIAFGLLYFFVDWIAGIYGAKKFGASKYGIIGTILGGVVGTIFFSLPGMILGSILGGAILEFIAQGNIKKSLGVALGAIFGFLVGTFGKLMLIAITTAIFLWGVFG